MDADGWTEITCGSGDRKSVQLAVTQALEEAGVPVNSRTPVSLERPKSGSKYFGVSIHCTQETLPYVIGGKTIRLPRIFAQTVQYLESNTKCEGLFRKAGSVSRQKALRASLESGGSLSGANPHDVAGLLKQYIRELPEPLTTQPLSPLFAKCQHLPNGTSTYYTLLACLLLPEENLKMLRVLTRLLSMVAADCEHSLMDCASLAIVMAPNFIHSPLNARSGGSGGTRRAEEEEKCNLKEYTAVLEALIHNAAFIGMIPKSVLNTAVASEHAAGLANQGIMSDNVLSPRQQKKKRRSASFSGIVEGISHRLKGKAIDTQPDEALNGTLKQKIIDNDMPRPKKPSHLPTGRSDCHAVQGKAHRRRMSFLNKLWPTGTDRGGSPSEATPSANQVLVPAQQKDHTQQKHDSIGPDKYINTPASQKVLLIGYSKLPQSNPRSRVRKDTVPLTPVREDEPHPLPSNCDKRTGGGIASMQVMAPPTAEPFVPLIVEFPSAPEPSITGGDLNGSLGGGAQSNRRLSILTAANRRKSGAKELEKPLVDSAFRMPADSPLLLPPSQLRVSLSYPDLTPSSRCHDAPPPPSETTPYKCSLKYSASVNSGSAKGQGKRGRGPITPAMSQVAAAPKHCNVKCAVSLENKKQGKENNKGMSEERSGSVGGPGNPPTLVQNPEVTDGISAEIRERQQCYMYDSHSNCIQKMNTSYCHAVFNHSSSSSSSLQSSGANGDRGLPSTPSYCGNTPLECVHKVVDKLKTPGSSRRCKRKLEGQPFLLALTPSWKRAKKEEQRAGEEETEKLSKRAQLYLVKEGAVSSSSADEGGRKDSEAIKGTVQEWIV